MPRPTSKPQAPLRRRRWPPLVAATLALVVCGAGAWWAMRPRGPEPPPVPDSTQADPEVIALIREATDEVRQRAADTSAWTRLGMTYEANGLFSAARRCYEHAAAIGDDARSWYRLAIVRARLGDVEGAVAAVERAIGADPSYAPAHWRLGLWLLDRGEIEPARVAFQRATDIDPADPGGTLGLARVSLQRREPDAAIEILERYLTKTPGDRYVLQLLGTAYRDAGRAEEAGVALAAGATGEPAWRDPWSDEVGQYRRGLAPTLKDATARLLAGQFDLAIPLLEDLQRRKPDDVALLDQLGMAYVAVGRVNDGLKALTAAVNRSPDHVETHLRLASAYLHAGDVSRALTHAERAVSLNPSLGRAHETRGMALWRAGQKAAALEALQAAVRYDPRNVSALVSIGTIQADSGEWTGALASFERAARTDPTFADAFVSVARVQTRAGALDEAETALGRAALLDPQNPRLGEVRAQLAAARQERRR